MTRDRTRWGRSVAGAVLGAALVAGYAWVVGPAELWAALRGTRLREFVGLLLVALVPLVLWGAGLHLVLGRLGVATRLRSSVLLFTVSTFCNGVTPFGQAGGDPPAAALFGRALATDFETGLAAIGSVNLLNRAGSLFLGLLGAAYLGSRVAFGATLRGAVVAVAGIAVGAVLLAAGAWHRRHGLLAYSVERLTPALQALARLLPGVEPPTAADVRRRGRRFLDAVERLAATPGRMAVVFALGVLGQLSVAVTLWLALGGLGVGARLSAVVLVVPVAKLGAVAPTPGGFGSAEALLATLLVTAVGAEPATAGAATVLYRGAAFWLPLALGGLASGWLALRGPGASRASPTEASGAAGRSHEATARLVAVVAGAVVTLLVGVGVHQGTPPVGGDGPMVGVVRGGAVVVLVAVLAWVGLRWSVASSGREG